MCIECGEVFVSGETLPALGHDYSNWELNAETNKEERHCLNCGQVEAKSGSTPAPTPAPNKGCKGSVTGLSGLFAILPLVIGVVIIKKGGKKDEN
jgi:hypothetical protein